MKIVYKLGVPAQYPPVLLSGARGFRTDTFVFQRFSFAFRPCVTLINKTLR